MDRTPNKGGRPKVFITKDVVERQKMLKKRRNDSRRKLHDMVPGGSTQAAGTPAPEQQRGNVEAVPHKHSTVELAPEVIQGEGIQSVDDGSTVTGKIGRALAVLNTMRSNRIAPDSYSILINGIIIDGLCKSINLDKARDIFHNLQLKGLHPNVKTYTIMIQRFCREGLLDGAIKLFVEMEAKVICPIKSLTTILSVDVFKMRSMMKVLKSNNSISRILDGFRQVEAVGANQSRQTPSVALAPAGIWQFFKPIPPKPYTLHYLPQMDFVNRHVTNESSSSSSGNANVNVVLNCK
ncbi:hypothetical protein POM88_025038 [Heracleum sosnowskyi]|uniref:Pentatricopeptide repeat-containing protein n=1 Tax=Heracleum sosnowskyi TaxID=360622 RepID=A0AAD8I385_9APIA|nr:hypothetical protein POM88_025038 [Heracleum sosnowskyi]